MPTLYASFSDLSNAERAVGDLLDHGVAGNHIHLIANRRQATQARQDIDHDHAGSGVTSAAPVEEPAEGVGQKVRHGLETLFSVIVRGVGMVIGEGAAAGTVADALDDLDHQAIEEAIATYFTQQGVPAETAQAYEYVVSRGGMILAIDLESEQPDAVARILDGYNGQSYTWNSATLERAVPVQVPVPEPTPSPEAPLLPDPTAAMLGHAPTSESL